MYSEASGVDIDINAVFRFGIEFRISWCILIARCGGSMKWAFMLGAGNFKFPVMLAGSYRAGF